MATILSTDEAIHKGIHDKLVEAGETLFKRASIRDLMFEGISVAAYLEVFKDPAMASLGEVKIPESFSTGKYAVYQGVRYKFIQSPYIIFNRLQ